MRCWESERLRKRMVGTFVISINFFAEAAN
jgi:hypothetical protein